jgi:hypothetical protein
MNTGEKDALLSYLELNLLLLIDVHTKDNNIRLEAVDAIIEDMYDILYDLDEVISPIAS